jgi:tetratricopeptide (TPR) repeat protein
MWALAAALLLLQAVDNNAEGRKALDAGKYAEAADFFAKAVAADATDFTSHFHLALSYSLLKRDPEAVTEYRKVLELKPGLYEAELNLGILLIRGKQGADAVLLLQRAVDAKPKEYRPRFYFGEALLAAGDFARAEDQFKTAAELNPKAAEAELGLAHAQARQNRLSDAAPHFRRAAELNPAFQDSLLELGELYEKASQPAEAIAIYRQFPDNVAARERLGQLLIETKNYADAIPNLEQAFTREPTPGNRLALAEAYLFDKQYDKALPLLEKTVQEEPRNYDLRMMYARALRDKKQFTPAAQQFLEAVKLKPDSRQAWNDLAGMLYITERYTQALEALDRAYKLGEDTPANHFFRAITYDKLRDLKPALENYKKFLAMSQGQNPDEEFKARQRARIIQRELDKR